MPARFELVRYSPAPRGRSQFLSVTAHGVVGAALIVLPALAPTALPEVQRPEPPVLSNTTLVALSPPRSKQPPKEPAVRRAASRDSVPATAPAPPRAAAPIPVAPVAFAPVADDLIASFDPLLDGKAGGGEPGGVEGGIPNADGFPGGLPSAGGTGSGGPLRVGGDVKAPVALSTPPPVYPDLALRVRVQGDVLVECTIGTDGRVSDAIVTSGHRLLQQAALEAVRRWRYVPTQLNGRPVAVRLAVVVRFQLR